MASRLALVTAPARPRLLLIDGHSMAYRAYFALPVENFATSTGQHTNAVYGFTSMLINLLRDEEPTHVLVAFDVSGATFRTDAYAEYKGNRSATPEEFRGQIPLIEQVLEALAVPSVGVEGYEADDVLATLSAQGAAAGMDVLICSGDRDTFQLITDAVQVLYPRKGVSDLARMDAQAVTAKYGVGPEQYSDLAALVGESSDNLPGVPKVGPKTAAKWIHAYGGLDGVIGNAGSITGVAGENLRNHLDQVIINRQVNRLLTDVSVPVTLAQLERQPYSREQVHQVFDALEFRILRDRLFAMTPTDAETVAAQAFEVDVTHSGVAQWLANRAGQQLGLDVSGPLAHGTGEAVRLGIADDGAALDLDLATLSADDEQAVAAWLADPGAAKALHDAKAAWHRLDGSGLALAGVSFDTAVAEYLCHPDQRLFALDDLAVRRLQREITPSDTAADGQQMLSFDGPEDDIEAGTRAVAVSQLTHAIAEDLSQRGGTQLLTEVELPVALVLARMEKAGIGADGDYLRDLERHFTAAVDDAASQAYEVIGAKVNLSSPKQLQEVLFEQLQMPKTRKTKTGYTTDADALSELYAKTEHPFLAHVLAHRDAIRLRQTVEGLLRTVAPDGRIHTTYSQTIAATGRLSSADPNLQNIPIRTEEGNRIRAAFVVGDGYESLMTADYSQIEMRIMAHLSGDSGLIDAFRSGEDLHSFVGSRVFEVEPDQVTPAMRSKIKAMSYGLAYGLSAFGLAKQLGISRGEANDLMEDYFERFGGVRDYLSSIVAQARATGYTETILGRRRYLPDLNSDNRQRREMAERMALNAPIQGSAADLIKVAMIDVDAELRRQGMASRILLQVHDELVVEVAPGEAQACELVLREQMGAATAMSVPLDVSVGSGLSWRDAGH
ncbi:MAG: DNA polymerase I [Beutenbergiaceae bacterium]